MEKKAIKQSFHSYDLTNNIISFPSFSRKMRTSRDKPGGLFS